MAISIKKVKGGIRVGKASQSLRTNDRVQIERATGKLKVQKPKLTVSAKVAVTHKKSLVIVKRGGIQIAKRSPVLIDYVMRSKTTAMVDEAASKKKTLNVTARTPSQARPTGVKQTSKVQVQKAYPRAQARGPSKQSAIQIVTPQKLAIQKNPAAKKHVESKYGDKKIQKDKMTVRLGNRPKPSVSNKREDKKLQKDEQLKEPQFYVSLKTAHAAPKLHPSLKPVDKSKPLSIVSARKQKLEQERKHKQVQKQQLTQKQLLERRRRALERDRLEQDRMDQREQARQQARIAQKKRMLEQLEMRRAKQQAAIAAETKTTSQTKETKTTSQTKIPPSRGNNNAPVSLLSRALKKATKQQPDVSDVSKDSSSKPAKKQTKRKLDSPNSHMGNKALRSAKQKVATTNPKVSLSAAVTDKKTSGRTKSAVKITVKPKSASSGLLNNQARHPSPVKKNAREPSKPGVATKASQVKVGQKTASPKVISKIANKTGTLGVKIAKKLKQNTIATAASKNGSKKQKSSALAARKCSASTTTATNTIPTKLKQSPKRKRGPTSSATAEKKKKLAPDDRKSKASPGKVGSKAVEKTKYDWVALPQRQPRDRTRRQASADLEVDGAIMEGGGQILRQTVATALLLEKSIHIKNIRGKRSSPGLRPQHLAVLRLMQRICQGTLCGDGSKPLRLGDTAITIAPKKGWLRRDRAVAKPKVDQKRDPGAARNAAACVEYRCELSTAGAVTLMLQAALPCLLFLQQPSRLILKGGTDVPFSPPLDFITLVLQPLLRAMGVMVSLSRPVPGAKQSSAAKPRYRRGVYPTGGGCAEFLIQPIGTKGLRPITRVTQGKLTKLRAKVMVMASSKAEATSTAQSIVNDLDTHLMDAITDFNEFGTGAEVPDIDVATEVCVAESSAAQTKGASGSSDMQFGAAVVVCAETSTGCLIGGDAIAISKPQAKRVSENAVSHLMETLRSGSCISKHALDHLVVFMALARGTSSIRCSAPDKNSHLATAIHFAQQMTGAKFRVLTDYHDRDTAAAHAHVESSLDLMAGVEENTVVIQCDGSGF